MDIINDFKAFKALKITGFGMSIFLCIFAAEYRLAVTAISVNVEKFGCLQPQ